VFPAAYAAYAQRFGLRTRASVAAMLAALSAAAVIGLALDRRIPALALTGVAFLAANADRLAGLFATPREG
jgi:hypothetical protein